MKNYSTLGFIASQRYTKTEVEHEANAELALKSLRKIMRPELINRFDALVTFRALTKKEVGQIFSTLLAELNDRLTQKGIHLVVKPAAKRHIISVGYDEKFGARPLRRAIQDELEHVIADGILSGQYDKGTVLTASVRKGKIVLDVTNEK